MRIINGIKRISTSIIKYEVEKFIFKALLGAWIVVILAVLILQTVIDTRDYLQERITEIATDVEFQPVRKFDVAKYESVFNLAKYPEGIEQYTEKVKRDPFLEYNEESQGQLLISTEHDFVLKSIDRIPLPMVYRGYIELHDRIIGQINWYDSTKFVKVGSSLNGYKIRAISKKEIEAINEDGEEIVFGINKPVFSDELQAELYDNISKKDFMIRASSVIDNYKVVEITPDYIILLSKGVETKLVK